MPACFCQMCVTSLRCSLLSLGGRAFFVLVLSLWVIFGWRTVGCAREMRACVPNTNRVNGAHEVRALHISRTMANPTYVAARKREWANCGMAVRKVESR